MTKFHWHRRFLLHGFQERFPKLKETVDKFINQNAKDALIGNMLYKKYAQNVKRLPGMHSKYTIAQFKLFKLLSKIMLTGLINGLSPYGWLTIAPFAIK